MPKPERQTARVALLIKPSMKRKLERRSRTEGVTTNEFIRRAIEQALGPTVNALAINPELKSQP
jgi:Ribbon-helix-helix protein, copG family